MKNLFKLLALFLIINRIIYGKITGVVTDQNSGKPLNNVEITIVKTNIGTTSNELGKFEIEYDYKKRELILIQSNALNTIKLGWGNIKFGLANEIYSVLHEKVCNDELFFINKEKYNAK